MAVDSPASPPTFSNYQLRLPAFEGPLDVLLRLIERHQLAIEDVSLVAVTSQFLEHVASMEHAPSAVVAEFAAVGARLTVLKSRSLLPRPPVVEEEPEQSDLTMQLRAYKQTKLLAEHLSSLHKQDRHAFAPAQPGVVMRPVATQPIRLALHDPASLVRSLRRRLTVVPKAPAIVRHRQVASLRDLADRVVRLVTGAASIRFSEVVAPHQTRTEVATAFLAVLVLIRRHVIEARQGDLFADFTLSRSEGAAADVPPSISEDFAQS